MCRDENQLYELGSEWSISWMMWFVFCNDEINYQINISQLSSDYTWNGNSQKNHHKWDLCVTDISWFLIGYGKIDDHDEDNVDIDVIINSDYIIVYETGSTNRSRLLGLGCDSGGNDEAGDRLWDNEDEWGEG